MVIIIEISIHRVTVKNKLKIIVAVVEGRSARTAQRTVAREHASIARVIPLQFLCRW